MTGKDCGDGDGTTGEDFGGGNRSHKEENIEIFSVEGAGTKGQVVGG